MVNGKNTRCKVAEVIGGLEINTDYIEMEGFGKNAIFDMFVQVSASWRSL
jgi:nucleoside-specific outer membrane channel protein Tsx